MNTKTKEGARNKGNLYFLRVPWNKGGLVNTGPVLEITCTAKSLSTRRRFPFVISGYKY